MCEKYVKSIYKENLPQQEAKLIFLKLRVPQQEQLKYEQTLIKDQFLTVITVQLTINNVQVQEYLNWDNRKTDEKLIFDFSSTFID